MAASLGELQELPARKDEGSFAKGAMFASRKMTTRLAASRESLSVENIPGAAYLRRKSNQGKAERKPPQA